MSETIKSALSSVVERFVDIEKARSSILLGRTKSVKIQTLLKKGPLA